MKDDPGQNVSPETVTDILGWVNGLKFGRFHIVLLLLTSLPILFAGYSTQIVAFAIPFLLKEWGLSSIKAGALISWGFVGFMLGSLFFGAAADRMGRKKMLMVTLIVCSLSTGLSYYASGFNILCVLRFFTGLGVGGIFPLSVTIVSEFTPSKLRARLLTVAAGSYTLGWVAAALTSMALVPVFGWRIVFVLGVLPLFLLPFMVFYLPESIHFLFGKTHHFSRFFMRDSADSVLDISREVARIGRIAGTHRLPSIGPARIPIVASTPTVGRLSSLFRPDLASMTVLLSLTYFLTSVVLYGISSWLPSLMVKAGFSITKSFSFSMVQGIGSCLGGIFLGYLLDSLGRKKGLILTYFFGGISVLLFGISVSDYSLYIAGAATGVFVLAAPTVLLVVCGETFPTNIRSTGVGLVQAMGKIGSILGPIIGGGLQTAGFSFHQFFVVFAFPYFVCLLFVFLYRTKKKGETLEVI